MKQGSVAAADVVRSLGATPHLDAVGAERTAQTVT